MLSFWFSCTATNHDCGNVADRFNNDTGALSMKKFILIALLAAGTAGAASQHLHGVTLKAVTIKNENAKQVIDIQYPQGFANPQINQTIEHLIQSIRQSFDKADPDAQNLPADVPGKDGLTITYKVMFDNQQAVSVLFNVSAYRRGAAHPNNTAQTLNFINGKPVTVAELFKDNTNALQKMADFSYEAIKKKAINDDEQWLREGTKATAENYKNWYFSSKGISIVFDPYQVAAYVYGPQTVTIPRAVIQDALRSDVIKAVWGN
ncbi:DUF3298 domain-containing protein [Legionella sp. MW5194]|nr:DUF3298 domain-containing protein [Legionella sp. MW5194]